MATTERAKFVERLKTLKDLHSNGLLPDEAMQEQVNKDVASGVLKKVTAFILEKNPDLAEFATKFGLVKGGGSTGGGKKRGDSGMALVAAQHPDYAPLIKEIEDRLYGKTFEVQTVEGPRQVTFLPFMRTVKPKEVVQAAGADAVGVATV